MRQNLIWLVQCRQILAAVIHQNVHHTVAAPAADRAIQPGKPHGEIGCRAAKRSPRLQTCQPTCSNARGARRSSASRRRRCSANAIGVPHEVRGMGDDLTVKSKLPPRRQRSRADCSRSSRAEPRLRITRMSSTDSKPSPDLDGSTRKSQGDASEIGFDRHQQRYGPRSGASVPDALSAAARRAGRRSWRRTRERAMQTRRRRPRRRP